MWYFIIPSDFRLIWPMSAGIDRAFFWFPKKTAINYKRRLSRDARSKIFFLFPQSLRARDRRVQYVWARYNTSNRDEMPFHKFFWAFKARNNIWLEIGVAGSPLSKKCYLRFPKPETRPPPTTIQTTFKPFLQTKHLLPILITTPDSLLDWIRDFWIRGVHIYYQFLFVLYYYSLNLFSSNTYKSPKHKFYFYD